MDQVSAESHERAARAQKDGLLADEIAPVEIPQRKGDPITIADDAQCNQQHAFHGRLRGIRPRGQWGLLLPLRGQGL